jgi:uroporphyrin-III C-methyltransferase
LDQRLGDDASALLQTSSSKKSRKRLGASLPDFTNRICYDLNRVMTKGPNFPATALELPEFSPGLVWLVGAGPGDPGLLTILGLHALQRADVIVYDALVDRRLLGLARDDAQIEFAGKRGGKPSPKQRDISLRLIEQAQMGKRVLRLKGGDPFMFGRGGEEAQTLVSAGIPFRVTPGVTAGVGGLAYAGIPATHRDVNQVVTFLTGHDQMGETPSAIDWCAIARGSPVIVAYMAMKHLARITASLIKGGKSPDEPVAIIQNATRPDQRVVETLLCNADRDAQAAGVGAPAVVVIGRAVLLRQALDWSAQLEGAAPRSFDPLQIAPRLRAGS